MRYLLFLGMANQDVNHGADPREGIIRNYIAGYNAYDLARMTENLADNMIFENIQAGVVTDSLEGRDAFWEQANSAKDFFSQRKQTITGIHYFENYIEVDIDYVATLAMDLSEEHKQGDQIKLQGRSIFEFNDDGKISVIRDIS